MNNHFISSIQQNEISHFFGQLLFRIEILTSFLDILNP